MKTTARLFMLASVMLLASRAVAEPSIVMSQEIADVAATNSVNIELMNWPDVRFGALDGEVKIGNLAHGGPDVAGFKKVFSQKRKGNQRNPLTIAGYGGLGIVTPAGGGAGTTAFTVGAAFTYEDGQMTLNANPVIEDDGTNSWTDAYLGAFYKLNNRKLGGKVLAVAEVELQLSAPVGVVTENITRLGLRWVPTRNVAVDLNLYDSTSGLQVPGLFRLNIGF